MKVSTETKNLFTALTKFRAQLKQPLKDATNPFFKAQYVPLENIVMVIDEAIKDTGLNYMQEVNSETRQVDTIITHESGEWIVVQGAKVNPVKNDPQAEGSAVSYAKRYSLAACFGITSDKDDDGNRATGKTNGSFNKPQPKPKKAPTITMTELTKQVEAGQVTRAQANKMVANGEVDQTK